MFKELSKAQKEILDLTGKNILKACPGSGKTFVIAHKVVKDLEQWKYKNRGMAILSFTNVAKDELQNKIRQISGLNTVPYPHFLGTLDAFISQHIFMPFGQLIIKCDSRPSIMENDFMERFCKMFWKGECYRNGCEPDDFHMGTDRKVYNDKNGFANCPLSRSRPCEAFKKSAYKKGYVTYDEALDIAIEILIQYPEILQLLVNRFPYFLVDEAQDTSETQMRLLQLLFNNGVRNAMLIGDPDQAIYEWRDADPSVFMKMYKDKEWNSNELNENFRCSQNICNATHVFSTLTNVSIAEGETKDCELKPIIIRYNKENKDTAIQTFLQLCKNNNINVEPEHVAVLVRGRSGLVGKDYSKIKDLWQTPETELLAMASYYKGIGNIDRTLTLLENFVWYIVFGVQVNVVDYKVIENVFKTNQWKHMVTSLASNLPDLTHTLRQWKQEITNVVMKFIDDNKLMCKKQFEIKTKSRVMDAKLKDFLEQPIQSFFMDACRKEYYNATIHAVKGCTYDAVMLILSSNGKLTCNAINTKSIDSEEIRTFYVAATRARKLFVLAVPDTVKKKNFVRFPEEYWDFVE